MNNELDPDLETFARALARTARPPSAPPGLRHRVLQAARQELEGRRSEPTLERWIGAVFRSRLFWTAWAAAMVLALATRPDSLQPAEAAAPVLAEINLSTDLPAGPTPPAAWLVSTTHRPRPTGPLLAESETPSWPELN